MIFFKDINVSGNTSIEGALTANQGVVIPTSASLSTDTIVNLTGNDIAIRTTGVNGSTFLSNDVEKLRIDDNGLTLSDLIVAPELQTNLIDSRINDDMLINVSGTNYFRLRPVQDDIFLNKVITSFFDITTTQRVLTNTINTINDADLTLHRNNFPFLQLQSSPVNTVVSLAGFNASNGLTIPVGYGLLTSSIVNQLNNDLIKDASLTNNIVFRGNATEQMRISSNGIDLSNSLALPVNRDISLGNSAIAEIDAGYRIFQITNPDGASGTFRIYIGDPASFGNQVFWMSNSLIVCRKPLEAGILQSNYINTVSDTDLVFARNGIEMMRLKNSPSNYFSFY